MTRSGGRDGATGPEAYRDGATTGEMARDAGSALDEAARAVEEGAVERLRAGESPYDDGDEPDGPARVALPSDALLGAIYETTRAAVRDEFGRLFRLYLGEPVEEAGREELWDLDLRAAHALVNEVEDPERLAELLDIERANPDVDGGRNPIVETLRFRIRQAEGRPK